MIEVMPAPVRETNERGEWINRESFREVSERYLKSLCQIGDQINGAIEALGRFSILQVESGGRVSRGARAVHIRRKAVSRERRRFPIITLDLTGIL